MAYSLAGLNLVSLRVMDPVRGKNSENSADLPQANRASNGMDVFYRSLKQKGFEGDIDATEPTRQLYSHDASLFELIPQVVIFPKNFSDLQKLVQAVND